MALCIGVLAPIAAHAQQVVASGGSDHQNSTTAIAYTIGEAVIATATAGDHTLTQGFHQPWALVTAVDENTHATANILVYPNPVRHTLHIATDELRDLERFTLHDAAGRLVTDGRLNGTLTELDMGSFASGMYVLRVMDRSVNTLRSFQISVTH